MAKKRNIFGFGFDPLESQHHFLVIIPRSNDRKVIIYERFAWQENAESQTMITLPTGLKWSFQI